MAPPRIIALFGPTGVGKTAAALALAQRLRARGEHPVAVSADAMQVYAGLEVLTGAATAAERAQLEHRLVSFVPIDARFSVAEYAELAHAEIDGLLDAGRRPIVVGGTGLYLRAALADLDLLPPPAPGARERWEREADARGVVELHRVLAERAPWAAEHIDPRDRRRVVRALELLDAGELRAPPDDSQLWTAATRRPTLLVGLVMERSALYARVEARVDAMVAAGAREEVVRAAAAGASPTARQALGFDELLAGDVEALKRRTRNYAKRQETWMRKLAGVRVLDVTGRSAEEVAAEVEGLEAGEGQVAEPAGIEPAGAPRPPPAPPPTAAEASKLLLGEPVRPVRFEKWQALGNDYVIVEASELPWELSPERVRRLCNRHTGLGSDGVLVLSAADEPGYVARLRIFNPDGSEAELSGNGARQAILYLRERGWTRATTFSIQTAAGEIRPTITGASTCRVDMGRAALRSPDYPSGGDDGAGALVAGGREWRFQHVSIGNPQCAIRVDADELATLDLGAIGPEIESHSLFPNRTNVSWFGELDGATIRARIYERGVGETLSSGTGASGAAVAHVLCGGDSPVTVHLDGGELEVEVSEDLHVDLTGWAVPVYRGELASELMEELDDAS